jgi:hypothetical protein
MNWAKITSLVVALVTLPTFCRAETPEHWEAASKTAYSITGDVTFTSTKITMAKNVTFAINFVRVAPAATWVPGGGADTPSNLYRIIQPQSSVLLGHNCLCGQKPATYISIAKAYHEVFLSAHAGGNVPTVERNEFCAGVHIFRSAKPEPLELVH